MAKQKFKNKQEEIQHETDYIAFLKKQLNSDNYKKNIPVEEYKKTELKYKKTELKYKKAKFRLKILLGK